VIKLITNVDGSHGVEFSPLLLVCLSVFPHDISKTDADTITKLDVEMYHDESWKLIYFEVKRTQVKVTSHKNVAGVNFCTLVSAVFC